MEVIQRCDTVGPIAESSGMKPAFENSVALGYANIPTVVPEGYHFVLAAEFGSFRIHFGDQFGELIFIAAIWHPSDFHGLPTGLMCIDAALFLPWLYPTEGNESVEPEANNFCFANVQEFIQNNSMINQIRLEKELLADRLKGAIKMLITYLIFRHDQDRDIYRNRFLGIQNTVQQDNSSSTTNTANTNLTEAEKEELRTAGPRRTLRNATKQNVSVGFSSKVPVGAISIGSSITGTTTRKQPTNGADGPPTKASKTVKAIISTAVVDLRTRGQKAADTRAENIAKSTQLALQQQQLNRQLQQQPQQQQQQQQQQYQQHQHAYTSRQLHQPQPVQQNRSEPPQIDKSTMRADMSLDFNMLEAAVSSYEKFADRRLDKLISTNTSLGYIQPIQQSTPFQNRSVELIPTVADNIRTPTVGVVNMGESSSAIPTPVAITTPVSALTAIGESRTDFTAAWNQLTLDSSWTSTASKTEWLFRIGANDVEALEFFTDKEIDELEGLLTVVPFRRFKKYMGR